MSPGQVGVERIPPAPPCSSDVVMADRTPLGQLLHLVGARGPLPLPLILQLARRLLRLFPDALSLVQD